MPLGLSWHVGRFLSSKKEKERGGLQSCKTSRSVAVSTYKPNRVVLAQFSLVMAAVILFPCVALCLWLSEGCAAELRAACLCTHTHTRAHRCRAGSASLLVTQLQSTVYRSQLCKRMLILRLAFGTACLYNLAFPSLECVLLLWN